MKFQTILKTKSKQKKRILDTLKKRALYKRLLECESNISKKEFTRKDLGF